MEKAQHTPVVTFDGQIFRVDGEIPRVGGVFFSYPGSKMEAVKAICKKTGLSAVEALKVVQAARDFYEKTLDGISLCDLEKPLINTRNGYRLTGDMTGKGLATLAGPCIRYYPKDEPIDSQRIADADFAEMERDGNHGHGAVVAMLFMFTIVFSTAAGGFWVESCTAAAVWSAIACAGFSAALFMALEHKVRE